MQLIYFQLAKKFNVNTGYQRFNKPLLVSYPRSGTNWIRYVIEYLTQKPTPGETRLIRGNNKFYRAINGDFVIDRAHNGEFIIKKHPKVFFILRNYKECLIRQFKTKWTDYPNIQTFLEDESLHTPCKWYVKNIDVFNRYQGDKKLLYFEDMIENPIEFIDDLVEFLNLPTKRLANLKENLTDHQKTSVGLYTKRGKESFTNGKKENLKIHSSTLSKNQLLEFDSYFTTNFPEITEKYLNRYLETQITNQK